MHLWSNSVLLAASLALVAGAGAGAGSVPEAGAGLAAGLDLALSTYQQCEAQGDALGCLKLQAIKVMHRALAEESLPLADGFTIVKAEGAEASGPPGDAEALARALPADAGLRQARLDTLLAEHAARLLRSRALALSVPRLLSAILPKVDEEAPEGEEGRKQYGGGLGGGGLGGGGLGGKGGKKGHGALLLAMLMKGSMIAYAYKALAVLAGKALLVAKVALVLASVIGLSHLVGGGHKATTYEIVKHPVVTHGYAHAQMDDHHHFDVADLGHGGHSGGFGGAGGGGGGGVSGGYGHGWGRTGVGRSLDAAVASPPPASQLVAPEAAGAAGTPAAVDGESSNA